MLSISGVMFGQLRAAKGHVKSVRPSKNKKTQPNKKNTMLPSSFPFQVIAYSSSSSHFLCCKTVYRKGRLNLIKFLSSVMLTALVYIKKIIFPSVKRKIEQK